MVFEKLRDMLAEQLEIDAAEITMDTNIVEDLGADSLDVVELIMSLEDEYDLVITDEAVRELHTIREVVEFIENLI
ncbi:MAG: acyl carrier protein [Oscillospiraceae bacterium]|nr:acyl carrier protein [Oscillospiraceae bacterium]MBR5261063.1 acyl carrier protein [Oscillospiraceae bacterium]